jgi:hypothetical protein
MANISLTLYTNGFFGSILKSPIQMGSLSVNNSVTNISCLGTLKRPGFLAFLFSTSSLQKFSFLFTIVKRTKSCTAPRF